MITLPGYFYFAIISKKRRLKCDYIKWQITLTGDNIKQLLQELSQSNVIFLFRTHSFFSTTNWDLKKLCYLRIQDQEEN